MPDNPFIDLMLDALGIGAIWAILMLGYYCLVLQ